MYDLWILVEGDDLDVAGKWATEEELFKLATIVQHDAVPAHLEAAYLFGNTPDLEETILEKAAHLAVSGAADFLAICGLGAGAGPDDQRHRIAYRGAAAWKHDLEKRGVEAERIVLIPQPDPMPHTGTEANHFVEWCGSRGYSDVAIVVHPAHALRAFTSTVSAIQRLSIELRVYVVVSNDAAWNIPALYSQHGEEKTKIDMLGGELDRLNRWHAKGDLRSASEVLAYIRDRDLISSTANRS
ncbi:MAG TPA: hypothetical protein VI483_02010 [Candidatus Paceibacterota bacterium]